MIKQLRHKAFRDKIRNYIRRMVLASQRYHNKTQLNKHIEVAELKEGENQLSKKTRNKPAQLSQFVVLHKFRQRASEPSPLPANH